jgi:hypothetical protein
VRYESGYSKLRDVLKENPSLADHTRELHLFAEHVQGATIPGNDSNDDEGDPGYVQSFDRLEKISITHLNQAEDQNALVKAFKRILERETLKALVFVERCFPLSLLDYDYAKHVTDLEIDRSGA